MNIEADSIFITCNIKDVSSHTLADFMRSHSYKDWGIYPVECEIPIFMGIRKKTLKNWLSGERFPREWSIKFSLSVSSFATTCVNIVVSWSACRGKDSRYPYKQPTRIQTHASEAESYFENIFKVLCVSCSNASKFISNLVSNLKMTSWWKSLKNLIYYFSMI